MKHTILLSVISALLFACGTADPTQKNEENTTENTQEKKSTQLPDELDSTQIGSKENVEKENVQAETEAKPDKPSTASEQFDQLVGTWLFTRATAGESDRTNSYPWGYLDSKTKKMTLLADGTIQYENDLVKALKIEKATWKIEKHETKDFYYFVTTKTADGVTETSREKIIKSTNKQFIFGKRFTVEYSSSTL